MSADVETLRKLHLAKVNAPVVDQSDDEARKTLEAKHGKVWNTSEMTAEFDVIGFGAPFCVVRRKSDGVKGSLEFTHRPRFYFNFLPAD